MDLMHEADSAPSISRPAYGDSTLTSLCLLAGVMAALFMRERTGLGQKVEVSLFNTAVYVLGSDLSGCLVTGEDCVRAQRENHGQPHPQSLSDEGPTVDDAGDDECPALLAGLL